MLTPQEVSERAFQKATFNGYNMSQVDEFLDILTADYSALYSENAVLKSKMKVLADKVEEYRATEDAMRQAFMIAQRRADDLVREAEPVSYTHLDVYKRQGAGGPGGHGGQRKILSSRSAGSHRADEKGIGKTVQKSLIGQYFTGAAAAGGNLFSPEEKSKKGSRRGSPLSIRKRSVEKRGAADRPRWLEVKIHGDRMESVSGPLPAGAGRLFLRQRRLLLGRISGTGGGGKDPPSGLV